MVQTKRICDTLTDAEVLICKEYGKSKVFLINQGIFPAASEEELQAMDE